MEFSTCDVSFGRQFQMHHEKGDVNDVWWIPEYIQTSGTA